MIHGWKWWNIKQDEQELTGHIVIKLIASSTGPHNYVAGWWWFPDVLHCRDVKADCLDVLIISAMGINVTSND